jgi:hypothetical protein
MIRGAEPWIRGRVVHRDERRRHAGSGLEELAARQALLLRKLAAVFAYAAFELALLLGLGRWHVFVARNALGADR